MRPRTVLLISATLLLAGLAYYMLRAGEGPQEMDGPDPVPAARPSKPPSPAALPPATAAAPRPGETGQPGGGRLVLRTGWGTGKDQLGRSGGHESNPEGPMSLTVDRDGNLLILDQVNQRVQRFGADGAPLAALALRGTTAQDLAVDPAGRTLVLDRLSKEPGIDLYDADGHAAGRLPVQGGALKEAGGITGLFTDADGAYVEDQHDDLVRVSGPTGVASDLSDTVPGRPTRDGKLYVKAGVIDRAAGRLYVQAHHKGGALAWETPVTLTAPVLHILLLDSDNSGNIYLGAEVGREDPKTLELRDLATLVVRLDSGGALTGSLALPPSTADPTESFRPLVVGPDGTLYHMVPGPGGVTVMAYMF